MTCPICGLPRPRADYCAACGHPLDRHTIRHPGVDRAAGCTDCECTAYTGEGCQHRLVWES